ncbi:MAG: hypothetical protein CMP51_03015 [Flavobacteriales bacterium]|nr:hypothetical protein [Flavobacteriales bacterium]|tara:strand:+ start:1632 stop:2534 length:903 start_codon:yes stop_codon:yes gene_type:complete
MKHSIVHYISELLYYHDCVVIPEFGGFITTHKSSILDSNASKIYPPSKEISFNKKLQSNDGLLIQKISIDEKTSIKEATKIVKEFVLSMKDELYKTKVYRLDLIGLFSLGDNNNISFIQDTNTNYSLDSYGLEKINVKYVDISTKIIPIAKTKNTAGKQILKAAAILLPIIGLSIMSIFLENKLSNLYSAMASLNPFEKDIIIKPKNEETPKNIHQKEQLFNFKNKKQKYFIIAGSFKDQKNANSLVRKLKVENFNASIIGKNKSGNYRVSYNSYNSKEEALIDLTTLKNKNKQGWILTL